MLLPSILGYKSVTFAAYYEIPVLHGLPQYVLITFIFEYRVLIEHLLTNLLCCGQLGSLIYVSGTVLHRFVSGLGGLLLCSIQALEHLIFITVSIQLHSHQSKSLGSFSIASLNALPSILHESFDLFSLGKGFLLFRLHLKN